MDDDMHRLVVALRNMVDLVEITARNPPLDSSVLVHLLSTGTYRHAKALLEEFENP